jgi:hypothetical protein
MEAWKENECMITLCRHQLFNDCPTLVHVKLNFKFDPVCDISRHICHEDHLELLCFVIVHNESELVCFQSRHHFLTLSLTLKFLDWASGAVSSMADCGSEGMGFDPHSGQSKNNSLLLSITIIGIVIPLCCFHGSGRVQM